MNLPQKIIITESLYCMDGGSTSVTGIDESGNEFSIHLLWSIKALETNTTKLSFNGNTVEKRSEDEEGILGLLETAEIRVENERPPDENQSLKRIAPPDRRLIIGDDTKAVLNSIDEGPEASLRHSAASIIERVNSTTHVEGTVQQVEDRERTTDVAKGYAALQAGEIQMFVDLLSKWEDRLTPAQKARLDFEKKKLADE